MKTIYVITSGEYSDYQINAVFDSKELAESFVEKFTSCDIEEYNLNPDESNIRSNRVPFFVRMDRNGKAIEVKREFHPYGFIFPSQHMFDRHDNMFIHCFANDEKHAIKIANEKRVQLIASNQWSN